MASSAAYSDLRVVTVASGVCQFVGEPRIILRSAQCHGCHGVGQLVGEARATIRCAQCHRCHMYAQIKLKIWLLYPMETDSDLDLPSCPDTEVASETLGVSLPSDCNDDDLDGVDEGILPDESEEQDVELPLPMVDDFLDSVEGLDDIDMCDEGA